MNARYVQHTLATDELLCLKNAGTQTSMVFTSNEESAPMAIEKNQNPGGRFGATRKTALPIQPIWPIFAVNGMDWQCCFAGSSKTDPWILIFSIAMGADYSFELNFIET